MGKVVGFVTLEQQALFGPWPEWEKAAREALTLERARFEAAKEKAAPKDGPWLGDGD